ncbi:hypothetical protein D5S10_12605 [Pseudomonas savastanoi]|nr:hypothetical protein C1E_0222725 [Pseudomonas amygdali pv. tabaci str. ATCC 11528]QED84283.1 hypothetical protein PSYTB_11645 [Pseudomonas amygdali pv. tabaci str. ATCC 11528]QOI04639.1 hypothetical protein D5S10_12605 [Pseudomonas savastanoi]
MKLGLDRTFGLQCLVWGIANAGEEAEKVVPLLSDDLVSIKSLMGEGFLVRWPGISIRDHLPHIVFL